MKCPHCGQEHPDNFQFCPVTGQRIVPQFKACTNEQCPGFGKYILPLDSRFCPTCGRKIELEQKSNINNTISQIDSTVIDDYYVIGNDCIACGTCIDECPNGAIIEGYRYKIDHDLCTACGTCADVCPCEAIYYK